MNIAYLTVLHSQIFRNTLYLGLLKKHMNVDLYPSHDISNLTTIPSINNLKKEMEIFKHNIHFYDYILIEPRNDSFQRYLNQFIRVALDSSIPIIIIDKGDVLEYRPIVYKANKYFKREFVKDCTLIPRWHKRRSTINSITITTKEYLTNPKFAPILSPNIKYNNIIPFFLGISNIKEFLRVKRYNKRDIDVSFIATPNNPIRKEITKILKATQEKHGLSIVTGSGYPLEEYMSILSRSKLSISAPGMGFDTFRYYEIPYLGSCLISLELPLYIPGNFTNLKSAVFIRDLNKLEETIIDLLDSGRWKKISKRGEKTVKKRFIDIKLAEYFLNNII